MIYYLSGLSAISLSSSSVSRDRDSHGGRGVDDGWALLYRLSDFSAGEDCSFSGGKSLSRGIPLLAGTNSTMSN